MFRLAVNLTQPTAMVLESQRLEEDDNKTAIYCELESGLLRSLPAFTDPLFFKILATKLKNFFNLVSIFVHIFLNLFCLEF